MLCLMEHYLCVTPLIFIAHTCCHLLDNMEGKTSARTDFKVNIIVRRLSGGVHKLTISSSPSMANWWLAGHVQAFMQLSVADDKSCGSFNYSHIKKHVSLRLFIIFPLFSSAFHFSYAFSRL